MTACLLDTGVLLRMFNRGDPRHGEVRAAVRELRRRGDPLWTTFQNLAEFWSVGTRPAEARGGFGLSPQTAARQVHAIERFVGLLDDSPRAFAVWKRLVVDHRIAGTAVHDARIVALMMVHGVYRVLTLNRDDFVGFSGIEVLDPRDVLERWPKDA